MTDLAALRAHLSSLGRVLLGYSGGVDSAFLAVVAREVLGPGRFLAVIGRSESYPEEQYRAALATAACFDIPVCELATAELEDPRYLANPTNRCYFCKSELWRKLGEHARARGFDTILDGTNADDLLEHRPGLRAAAEWKVRSPLAELGWTKPMIRAAARELDLSCWDAPAAPCLSSRVAYGVSITSGRLRQVERGEAYLRSLGISGDLRVRHDGARARLEVAPREFERVRAAWDAVERAFGAIGFQSVELDPRGYRRGSLLPDAAAAGRALPVVDG